MSRERDVASEFPREEELTSSSRTTVYRSRDARSGRAVAVKLISLAGVQDPPIQRFLRAVGVIRSSAPASFPRIVDFGLTTDGQAYLVTEFVGGQLLSDDTGSAPQRMVKLLADLVDGLENLARGGVCHNNLTPQNILVVSGSSHEEVRILGLGTAPFLEADIAAGKAQSSPSREKFTAPERLQPDNGTSSEKWRSDLYSLAAIAIDVLGAEAIGVGGDNPAVSLPEDVRGTLLYPEKLENALSMALRKDPRQRKVGWADLHHGLSLDAPAQPEAPSLDATVRIPLDQLPTPEAIREASAAEAETGSYDVENPPRASDDSYNTDAGESLVVAAPGVLGNDVDDEDKPLQAVHGSGPDHGSLTLNPDGSFTYVPDEGFDGEDSFTYKANNGRLDSDVATVTITVDAIAIPPIALDDAYSTDGGRPLAVKAPGVLANDTDADNQPLRAIRVSPPSNGTLIFEPDGSFCYTPAADFYGEDSFSYKATNGSLTSNVATVTMTVKKKEPKKPKEQVEKTVAIVPPVPRKKDRPPDKTKKIEVAAEQKIEPPPLPTPPPVKEKMVVRLTPPQIPEEATAEDPPTPPPLPTPIDEPIQESEPWSRKVIEFVQSLTPTHWAVIAGGLVVLLLVIVMIALSPESPEEIEQTPPPTAVPPTRPPTPVPTPTLIPAPEVDTRLRGAENSLIAGDVEAARSQLQSLTADDIAGFSQEEAGLHDYLLATLEGGRIDEAVGDLRGGLNYSSVKMIRRALAVLAGTPAEDIAAVPGLSRDLRRGREALRMVDLMNRALESGDQALLLERATELLKSMPKYSTALNLREQSAVNLETQAESLAERGEYLEAAAILEPVSRHWPDRQGLQDRLAGYSQSQAEALRLESEVEEYQNYVSAALERGAAGAPDEGLRMLERRQAPPSQEAAKRQAIANLQARLASLDASPPKIDFEEGTVFVFKKNETARITLRVTDDFRVVRVKAFVRRKGAVAFSETSLSPNNNGLFTLGVAPEVHRNTAFEVYFEAVDLSGNTGRQGSTGSPLLVKKKGLFK